MRPRPPSSSKLTRRDLIAGRLLGGLRRALTTATDPMEPSPQRAACDPPPAPPVSPVSPAPAAPAPSGAPPVADLVAHILPRQCLAWRKLDCVVCLERCPVQGAIALHDGKPYIVADHCTGCGDCQRVCPAPSNAIMLLPRRA